MPLGAARITFLAKSSVTAVAEVIRRKVGVSAELDSQVDSAQSQFGGASLLLDGTGDYLRVEHNTNLQLNLSNATAECWFRGVDVSSRLNMIFSKRNGNTAGYQIYTNNGTLNMNIINGGSGPIAGSTSLSNNTWYHMAMVKEGTTFSLYLNGSLEASGTYTMTTNDTDLWIGRDQTNSTRNLNGHIDEVRFSNTARYTENFTPQTHPHVNDANTLLLLHMDGTDGSTLFEDDNGVRSKVGVSAVGDAQVDTAESQFGGASLLLDGTGDYLSVNLEPNTDLNFADDLTVEMWVRLQNTTQTWHMFAAGNDAEYFGMKNVGGGVYNLNTAISNGPNDFFYNLVIPTTPSADTWYHVAMVKDSSGVKAFFNGDELTTVNNSSGSFSADKGWNDVSFIGRYVSNLNANGHIDEVRVSNTARYTSNFTPHTEPHVNDANTLLLLHMDGTDGSTVFEDDNGVRAPVGVTAYNGAQVDAAEYKLGGASYLGNRASQTYLDLNDTVIPATDTFTIECWINLDIVDNNAWVISQYENSENGRMIFWPAGTNNTMRFFAGGDILEGTTPILTNTWYHIAVCRDANNEFRLYVDGDLEDTATSSVTISTKQSTLIGRGRSLSSRYVEGHIDEVRVSNMARYTTSFTPQTEPFQNDDNTLLLLHMDGTDGSTVFTDDNGVTPNYNYGA